MALVESPTIMGTMADPPLLPVFNPAARASSRKLRGARLQPSDPFRLAPELTHCRERCGRARRRRADAEDEAGGGIFR
jgi:hypothetical protein